MGSSQLMVRPVNGPRQWALVLCARPKRRAYTLGEKPRERGCTISSAYSGKVLQKKLTAPFSLHAVHEIIRSAANPIHHFWQRGLES